MRVGADTQIAWAEPTGRKRTARTATDRVRGRLRLLGGLCSSSGAVAYQVVAVLRGARAQKNPRKIAGVRSL
ncbi:MAG: hypothetical protein U5L04_16100 [Trueperaceae bacterium]|nr:hypothetical protein [Trueperaceae bacterium]